MTSLQPCPFCGSDQVSPSYATNVDNVVSVRFVECEDCAACGPTDPHEPKAIAAWNRWASPATPIGGLSLGVEGDQGVSVAGLPSSQKGSDTHDNCQAGKED